MSTTSATYFTNDRLASLTQGTLTRGYSLDPDWRTRQRSASDTTTQTYHYSDDSDSPSWTVDSTKNNPPYTRNVEGVDGNLVATVVSGTTTLQLADLHGDIVATASTSTSATGPASTMESDEFGVPRSPFSGRYGWLGGKQRRSELPTGAIAMGQRLYIPQLGRFTQTDPVPGGSANAYDYVNQDPLDQVDLGGTCAAGATAACHPRRVCDASGCITVCSKGGRGGGAGFATAVLVALAQRYGGCIATFTLLGCGAPAEACIKSPGTTTKEKALCVLGVCAQALRRAARICGSGPRRKPPAV